MINLLNFLWRSLFEKSQLLEKEMILTDTLDKWAINKQSGDPEFCDLRSSKTSRPDWRYVFSSPKLRCEGSFLSQAVTLCYCQLVSLFSSCFEPTFSRKIICFSMVLKWITTCSFQYLKHQVLRFCWILNFQQVRYRWYAIFQTVLYNNEVYARFKTKIIYPIQSHKTWLIASPQKQKQTNYIIPGA